ncbi:MAG: hypothetical protein ACTHJJ_09850, partial [Intrasporangium sp.]|uniref:hypothetical protein n=1 Tax=Intrasporangium sp. TaxID=1925024 RepID=UPI003F7F4637
IQTIDPSTINNRSGPTYSPQAPDVGDPAQVAAVKAAAVALFGDFYEVGAVPRDMAKRHDFIVGAEGKAARASKMAKVWDPRTRDQELAYVEKGVESADGDTTGPDFVTARFIPESWQNVTAQANRAQLQVTGHIEVTREDGSIRSNDTRQWHLELVRGGSPDHYNGWRLLSRTFAEVPEEAGPGSDPTSG